MRVGKGPWTAALVGLGAVLVYASVHGVPLLHDPLHVRGLFMCAALSMAVALCLHFLLRDESETILGNRDLLFPLVLLTVAEFGGLPLCAALLPWLTTGPSFGIGILTIGLSVFAVATVAVNVAYTVWASLLVAGATRGRLDALAPFRNAPGRPLVLAALTLLGWTTPLLAVATIVAVTGPGSIGLALPLIGLAALAWNLATSAWLAAAATHDWSLRTALVEGTMAGWLGLRRFGSIVFVQLMLLGMVTFVHVSYSPSPGSQTVNSSWHVNAWWAGGFKHATDWYGDYMAAMKHGTLDVALIPLQLVLGVLAIAVRLRIARHVAPPVDLEMPADDDYA